MCNADSWWGEAYEHTYINIFVYMTNISNEPVHLILTKFTH